MRKFAWLLLLMAGCGPAATGSNAFTLDELSITGPQTISGGAVVFDIDNVGEFNHTMLVTDAGGNVVAATDVVAPGAEATLSLDLAAGSYQVSCRLVSQDGEGNIIDHYELGMFLDLKVGE